jgi:major membrane immunogen (membrane-anchored lipoprotein)
MSTEVVVPTTNTTTDNQEGLSFEVRECDDVATPISPCSPLHYENIDNHVLMRSESASETDVVSSSSTASETPKDPNINRIQLGENSETLAMLHFLSSQGVDTTKLVTQHMMKYASRVRVAQTDDGKIIGCLVFDNETEVSKLQGITPEEANNLTGPFIFMQLIVIDPEYANDTEKRWKERLVESFMSCVVKNGKIAIIRADADNEKDINTYKSCGFLTMKDMDIPSYTSSKDNMEIMVYTPLGIDGTSKIFKKFYDMGARF